MARVKQIQAAGGPAESATNVDAVRGRAQADPDATQSGAIQVTMPALSPGSAVQQASLRITGKSFHGLLKYLNGANITASPVAYDSAGKQQSSVSGQHAFLVDFTGMRTVLGLKMHSLGSITLVLPWAGTGFSDKPAYPAPSGPGPFSPMPDTDGTPSVGFAGMDTVKLLVQVKSGSAITVDSFSGDCRIVTGTFPSNVKVSINQRPPFFTHPGVLNGAADVAGMAADLNAAASAANAALPVVVTIATDTPGVLETDFNAARDLAIQLSATARFGGQGSVDLDLAALAVRSVPIPFPTASHSSWQLSRLELDLAGTFPPWRAFAAQASDVPGAVGLRVNAQFSVARRFPFSEDGDLYGFSLLFRASVESAQMRLELVADDNGQPAAGPAVASADVAAPAGSEGASTWVNALFASPVRVSAQRPLWMTLRVKTGAAEWAGATLAGSADGTTLLNNEGGAWQSYPAINGQAVVAMARVLRRPFNKENQALLTLAFQGQSVSAELVSSAASPAIVFAAGAEPTVPSDGSQVSAGLAVTALAAGKLTIRKARAYYQEIA